MLRPGAASGFRLPRPGAPGDLLLRFAFYLLPVHLSVEKIVVRIRLLVVLALLTGLLSGCGYNTFQSGDEAVKAAWSEVIN